MVSQKEIYSVLEKNKNMSLTAKEVSKKLQRKGLRVKRAKSLSPKLKKLSKFFDEIQRYKSKMPSEGYRYIFKD